MHKIILSKRNSVAQEKILKISEALADKFKVDSSFVTAIKVQEKDPEIKALKQREAIAELLGAIAESLDLRIVTEEYVVNEGSAGQAGNDEVGGDQPATPSDDDPVLSPDGNQTNSNPDGDPDWLKNEQVPGVDGSVTTETGTGLPEPTVTDGETNQAEGPFISEVGGDQPVTPSDDGGAVG